MLVLACLQLLLPLQCLAGPAIYDDKDLDTTEEELTIFNVKVNGYDDELQVTITYDNHKITICYPPSPDNEETERVASHIWEIHHKLAINRNFQENIIKGRRWTIGWLKLSNRPYVAVNDNDVENKYGFRYTLIINIYNDKDECASIAVVKINRDLEITGYFKMPIIIF
jgi:hypothetical protein